MCEGDKPQWQVVLAAMEAMTSLAQETQRSANPGRTQRPLETASQVVSGQAKVAC
jgi:hypothetical protein